MNQTTNELRALCYRLRTGPDERKWQWQNGEPSQGVLDLANAHGYVIEYAYPAAAAPDAGWETQHWLDPTGAPGSLDRFGWKRNDDGLDLIAQVLQLAVSVGHKGWYDDEVMLTSVAIILARHEQAQGGMAVEYVYRDKTGESADQVSRYPFPSAWSDRWELIATRPSADARQETQG